MKSFRCIIPLLFMTVSLTDYANQYHKTIYSLPDDIKLQRAVDTDTDKVNTKIVKEYVPIPMPGQAIPVEKSNEAPSDKTQQKQLTKAAAVDKANKTAMQYPSSENYINSIMTYQYMNGAMYVVYTSPGKITDIQFEAGEQLTSYAAGDTTRWLVSKTSSGYGARQTQHLLIKPVDSKLSTTLVVMTNLRVYHLMLKSTDNTFMASVDWQYPNEMLTPINSNASSNISTSKNTWSDINVMSVNANYQIKPMKGHLDAWMPNFIFNTDHQTFIHFPNSVAQGNLPALLVGNGSRTLSSTANYRVRGNYMIVDGIYPYLELVEGTKQDKNRSVVQIIKVPN